MKKKISSLILALSLIGITQQVNSQSGAFEPYMIELVTTVTSGDGKVEEYVSEFLIENPADEAAIEAFIEGGGGEEIGATICISDPIALATCFVATVALVVVGCGIADDVYKTDPFDGQGVCLKKAEAW